MPPAAIGGVCRAAHLGDVRNLAISDGRRVIRGGAWCTGPVDLRVSSRNWNYPDSRAFALGL